MEDVATQKMPKTFVEELTNNARDEHDVLFSQNQIDSMVTGIEENKISEKGTEEYINTVVEKHKEKGLRWEDKPEPTQSGVVATMKDKDNQTVSYLLERTNKETQEKFYVAKEIQKKGDEVNHKDLFTGNKIDKIKDTVSKIQVARTCASVRKEAEQGKNVAQKQQERGMEL